MNTNHIDFGIWGVLEFLPIEKKLYGEGLKIPC